MQGLRVNGRKWTSTSLPHDLLAKGGVLDFDMGPRPSSWGTGKDAAPTSITTDDKVASPQADVVKGAGALFDNTSATSAKVAEVDLPVPSATDAVRYTLTSDKAAEAPTGWVLKGSSDGTAWKDLDKRSAESFAWDKQTRVFSVGRMGHVRALPPGVRR